MSPFFFAFLYFFLFSNSWEIHKYYITEKYTCFKKRDAQMSMLFREMACWNHLGSSLWAKKLLQKGNFSIWPQCRLSSVEARQLLGEWPAGKGGLQRIHLESSSQSLVPTTHSWCAAASEMVSVAVRAADPLCSVSLTQTLRLPDSLLMERGKHLLNHKLHIPCLISSLPQPAGGHPDLHQVPTVRPWTNDLATQASVSSSVNGT